MKSYQSKGPSIARVKIQHLKNTPNYFVDVGTEFLKCSRLNDLKRFEKAGLFGEWWRLFNGN